MKHTYTFCKLSTISFFRLNYAWALLAFFLIPGFASAQVPLTMTGGSNSTYVAAEQLFDGLPATGSITWVNPTGTAVPSGPNKAPTNLTGTLPGWYISVPIGTTIAASDGTTPTPGVYSFGTGSNSDRSLGIIAPVGTDRYYAFRLVNRTGKSISKLNVEYALEQWYYTGGQSETIEFSYKKGSITSGDELPDDLGWTTATHTRTLKTLWATGPSKGLPGSRDGNDGPTQTSNNGVGLNKRLVSSIIDFTLPGFTPLADGAEIVLRWKDTGGTQDRGDNGLGIDNVKIEPFEGKTYYYVGGGAPLNLQSSWKDSYNPTNGQVTGTSPNFTPASAFNLPFHTYKIVNDGPGQKPVLFARRLDVPWTISGAGSKLILGSGDAHPDGRTSLTIAGGKLTAKVDVSPFATLTINNQVSPHLGALSDYSLVEYFGDNTSIEQTVDANDYYDLSFDGKSIKKLTSNAIVRSDLILNGSNTFQLEQNNLLTQNMIYQGESSGVTSVPVGQPGYVTTNDVGSLRRSVPASTSVVRLFPIGFGGVYNPVSIGQQSAAGITLATDIFSARVSGGLRASYDPDSNPPAAAEGISRTWAIREDVPGGTNATMDFGFSAPTFNGVELIPGADWLPDFDMKEATVGRYTGNGWEALTKGDYPLGNIPYFEGTNEKTLKMSQAGIQNPNRFAVFNWNIKAFTPVILPVELLSFNAARQTNGEVELKWQTATEKNNSFFSLEQSTDSKNFKIFAEVSGAGTTMRKTDYRFIQKDAPAGLVYYRLKQTDFDGKFTYSKIIALKGSQSIAAISVYPNPSQGQYNLLGAADVIEATIQDQLGRTVKHINPSDLQKSNLQVDLSGQKNGMYYLRLNLGNEVKTLRLVKQ